ncbi:MAG: AsmA family protein, partial [Pseudomonadota bacterium]
MIVAILIAAPFALIFWLESEPGHRFIERRAYQATGREITIGDLDIRIGWQPGLRVTGLRITNPDWAKTRHLIDAALIDARFRLMPLLTGRVVVEHLTLSQAQAGLEREAQRNTWTFRQKPDDDDTPSRFFVHRINIDRGFLVYRDTTVDVDLEIDVAGDVGAGGALDLFARGMARGQKARGVARIPGALPTPDTA